jgi:hypothetical protein
MSSIRTTPTTPTAADRRARLRERRATRAARSRLRAELASYTTGAERAELAAILSRHTEQEIAELEALVR